MDCGARLEPHQMDFDHRDPARKSFRLTEGRVMLMPQSRVLSEVAKCDIVCANCHRVRTWRQHVRRLQGRPLVPTLPGTDRARLRWRAQARLLDELRKRPCIDCGGRFLPCAMDFDHRDAASKRASVTRLIGRIGTTRLIDEVGKCDIVCANCHRLRTFHRRSLRTSERE
jgi:hypothetical protein